jgi:hypothetical protein
MRVDRRYGGHEGAYEKQRQYSCHVSPPEGECQ